MKWPNAKPDVVEEVVRDAQKYLEGQLSLATSADQRAAVMASIFAAAGTGLVAGLAAGNPDRSLFYGGLLAAALFLIGSGLCALATLPADFYLPGSQPDSWEEELKEGTEPGAALRDQVVNSQTKINRNGALLIANSKKFKWGAVCGIAAPFIGLLVWLIASRCPPP
jgi:hypothetical protein